MAIFDHFWPFLGFQMCGTPLKVFACVPETLGGYPLRRYHTTMGPGETFWETPGPIQGLRTGFPIGRPILASKIGLFKIIFGSFWAILCHIWSFLAIFGRIWVIYDTIWQFLTKNHSKRHFLGYFWLLRNFGQKMGIYEENHDFWEISAKNGDLWGKSWFLSF